MKTIAKKTSGGKAEGVRALEARVDELDEALARAIRRQNERSGQAAPTAADDGSALARRLPTIARSRWGHDPASALRHAVSSLYLLSSAIEHDDDDGNFGTHNARLLEIVDVLDAVVEDLEERKLSEAS